MHRVRGPIERFSNWIATGTGPPSGEKTKSADNPGFAGLPPKASPAHPAKAAMTPRRSTDQASRSSPVLASFVGIVRLKLPAFTVVEPNV
jgi:hypothetical protein